MDGGSAEKPIESGHLASKCTAIEHADAFENMRLLAPARGGARENIGPELKAVPLQIVYAAMGLLLARLAA